MFLSLFRNFCVFEIHNGRNYPKEKRFHSLNERTVIWFSTWILSQSLNYLEIKIMAMAGLIDQFSVVWIHRIQADCVAVHKNNCLDCDTVSYWINDSIQMAPWKPLAQIRDYRLLPSQHNPAAAFSYQPGKELMAQKQTERQRVNCMWRDREKNAVPK